APILIIASIWFGNAILIEATLSFLGLGTQPPTPSWGLMLSSTGRAFMEQAPWLAIFPGLAISLAVLGFNLFGDTLRDAWDPGLAACLRHPRDLVRVVVVLDHASGLVADLFLGGEAHAHDAGALELGADAVGVDLRAAIDGDVHSRDRQLPLLVDRRFYHRRHVGHAAVGDGDALTAARGPRVD